MTVFPARKWAFGMDGLQKSERMALVTVGKEAVVEPTGQLEIRDEGRVERKEVSKEKKKSHLESRAWEVATAPGKQFAMTGAKQFPLRQLSRLLCNPASSFPLRPLSPNPPSLPPLPPPLP